MSSLSSNRDIGQMLMDRGWKQGVLLPALAYTVVFDPNAEGTRLGKEATTSLAKHQAQTVPHSIAVMHTGTRPTSRLVIVSQTCDIARSVVDEPYVLAMPVSIVNNDYLARNRRSGRVFILDETRGLLVDARTITLIDKPMLLNLTPELGCADANSERRFARWLAKRFLRPVHPDKFVENITRPIQRELKRLNESRDAEAVALSDCTLRVVPPPDVEALPYQVDVIVVLPEEDEAARSARISLISPITQRLPDMASAGSVESYEWTLVGAEELLANDLLDTDELFEDS